MGASAWTGENGLDRAASKVFATTVAATTARLQLYKNHGADGSKSDESGSTSAPAGENGLDRAASKVFATSVAETMARLQLYQNHAMLAAPNATKGCVDEEEGRAPPPGVVDDDALAVPEVVP